MADLRKFGATSNLIRFVLKNKSTGQGLTGLSSSTSGIIISSIADNEASATTYTQAGSTIESITTLGTFAAPTSTKCRFKEVDATNHPGLYEFQIADARFAVSSSKRLVVSVGDGGSTILNADYEIELVQFDPFDSVRMGQTALPNAAAEAAGGLYTRGTGAGQINQDANGRVDANVKTWIGGTIPAVNVTGVPLVDAKYLLGTIWSTPTVAGIPNVNVKTWNDLTTVALPLVPTTAGRTLDVSAGGEAGVDWANVGSPTTTVGLTGTTIATSQVVASVSGAVGSVTGAVGSVTGAVGSVTGNVGGNVVGSVASVTAAVTLSAGDSPVLQSGTAAAGAATTITIQTALGADSLPVGCKVKITSGTGVGQCRTITAYVNATKVATVDRAWTTNPDNTSVYTIFFDDAPKLDASLQVTSTGSGTFTANITAIDGVSLASHAAGMMPADVLDFGGAAGTFSSGKPAVTVASTDVTGNVAADLQTIKTQTVTCSGGVTVPAATLASTTNITAGTITTVTTTATATNVTTVNGLAAGVITAASIAADAITAAKIADGAIDTATFASGTTLPRVTLVDTLTTYTGNTPQTGDSFARLGAPAGASVSADVAAVKTDTGNLVTRVTATLFSGVTSLAQWLGLLAGKQTGNSTARTELRATGAGSGTFDETTDSTEAIRDRGDAAWTTSTGFSTLTQADVRAAVGLASANLDTQLAAIQADTDNLQTRIPAALVSGRMDASVGAYQTGLTPLQPTTAGRTIDVSATGEAGLDFDNVKDASSSHTLTNIRIPNVTLTDAVTTYTGNTVQTGDAFARLGAPTGASIAADIQTRSAPGTAQTVDFTVQVAEGFSTAGAVPTLAQMLHEIRQGTLEFGVVGTTLTVRKKDASTAAMTFTLNDATTPTNRTRAS